MDAVPLRIVLSRHGELLRFARAAGGLGFGPLDAGPANTGVAAGGAVVVTTPGSPIADTGARCDSDPGSRLATLRGLGEDRTVLLADPGLLTTLRELRAGRWLRQGRRPEAMEALPQEFGWPGDFVLSFGGLPIDLVASSDLLETPADPDALFVLDPQARVEWLLRFDPVVAFTAFGPNMALFRCLEASLYSLARVARFRGRVIILSDRAQPDIEFLVPGELRPRTHFERIAAHDVMAMALARYRLPDLAAARLARPLLYVDTDVIFDAPIERLLAEIVLAQRLCVFAEDDLMHPLDFYGATLVVADPSFTPRHERGFSTGVLGIPDPGCAAPFRALLALAEAQAVRSGVRGSTAFDQRFANYLMHKLTDFDDIVLNRHETYCNGREPDLARRLGLAHFAGGVGNAGPKLARMQAYLTALQAADAAAA